MEYRIRSCFRPWCEVLPGVRNRAVQSGVRAYGEMVALLWKAGAHEAAAQLERLNSGLEEALDRAMHEGLGPRLEQLRELMRANHRPAWGKVPPAEALVLWLRSNLPGTAERIVARTREYYTRAS